MFGGPVRAMLKKRSARSAGDCNSGEQFASPVPAPAQPRDSGGCARVSGAHASSGISSSWDHAWSAAERLGAGAVVPDARLLYPTTAYEIEAFAEANVGTERLLLFAEKLRR